MADDIEVEITVPDDNEIIDTNDNGIPDGIEIGRAAEQAETAEETADEALEEAEQAAETADVAVDVSFATAESVAELQTMMVTMGNAMAAQQQQIEQLTALAEANARAATAQMELQMHGNQPVDEPPRSGHWLTRTIGGR